MKYAILPPKFFNIKLFQRAHLNTCTFPDVAATRLIALTIFCISFLLHPRFLWSRMHSLAKSSLTYCCCVHLHRFCWFFSYATHKWIVSFPYKCNTAVKNFLWKWQKTVGHLLIFRSLLWVASGGVTYFILLPLHFLSGRLSCYVCGPTRWVSVVFVTMHGGNSTHHWKSRVLVLSDDISFLHNLYIII
jgi:hypothetical protein